jgi:S1-C subfamily serine protease
MHPGDVLVAIEARLLNSLDDLRRHLGKETVGQNLSVNYLRSNRLRVTRVVPRDN